MKNTLDKMKINEKAKVEKVLKNYWQIEKYGVLYNC